MSHARIRQEACDANRALPGSGLVVLTWGNASAADRESGAMAIKPSGVAYDDLAPDAMVVVDLATGAVLEGSLRPSSDTATHLELYRAFGSIGGIVHTHSAYATIWAQAGRDIPCLGTTHADHFLGPVPVARALTREEVREEYEAASGLSIIETFRERGLSPDEVPAALLPGHAPFAWGPTAAKALENAIALEAVARMAIHTLALDPAAALPAHILEKHHSRKHGPAATYGQPGQSTP